MKKLLILVVLQLFIISAAYSQVRIAVLPFTNMDGNAKYNAWCFRLQDSLAKALIQADPSQESYQIVPMDSVEAVLSEMNIDPTSAEYLSDMWKAVVRLNVSEVITGNFKVQANRFLINAYIYDVKTKLPNHLFQSRDNFKKEEKVYEAIPVIVKDLTKAYKK